MTFSLASSMPLFLAQALFSGRVTTRVYPDQQFSRFFRAHLE